MAALPLSTALQRREGKELHTRLLLSPNGRFRAPLSDKATTASKIGAQRNSGVGDGVSPSLLAC